MSSSGFLSRTTRSASLPASSEPRSWSKPMIFGAVDGRRLEHFDRRHAAHGEAPHLPVVAEPLELAVAADARRGRRRAGSSRLIRRPSGRRYSSLRAHTRRRRVMSSSTLCGMKRLQLLVVVHLGRRVEVLLRRWAAVVHQQRRRVRDLRPGEELDDVLVEREDRQRVLVAVHAVDGVGDVQLHVAAAFGRRHQPELLRGLHHPLALLAVADHVGLDVGRAVVLLVALQIRERGLVRLEVVAREDAGPGR